MIARAFVPNLRFGQRGSTSSGMSTGGSVRWRDTTRERRTGLMTREAFDAVGPATLRSARRRDETVSMLLFDFDADGTASRHEQERAATDLAEFLQPTLRGDEIVARGNVHELIVVFPGLDESAAAALTARLAGELATNGLRRVAEHEQNVEVTLAMTSVRPDEDPPSIDDVLRSLRGEPIKDRTGARWHRHDRSAGSPRSRSSGIGDRWRSRFHRIAPMSEVQRSFSAVEKATRT